MFSSTNFQVPAAAHADKYGLIVSLFSGSGQLHLLFLWVAGTQGQCLSNTSHTSFWSTEFQGIA